MKRQFMYSVIILFFLMASNAFAASVPNMASAIGRELDRQLAQESGGSKATLVLTTPVNINKLQEASPLARQVQEELARWFVQAGYVVQEPRLAKNITFSDSAETILTRDNSKLVARSTSSSGVVAGTYSISGQSIRFNIKVIQSGTQKVLAMSTMSVPLTHELALLAKNGEESTLVGHAIRPTVYTMLP